ncbi:MAG: OmpA family protein [Saprospiraceae bacterium]|nr:OmpA family protein [Lewinellaceae bacterium]
MRILTFFLLLSLLAGANLAAQNYPPNPEPGDCYIRCPIEEITEVAKVVVTPSYMEYKVVPAEYKTVEERILVKEASKRFEYVPAVYREVIDTIMVEEPYSTYTLQPVETIDTFEIFEIQPAYSRFESRPAIDGCTSPIPGECDVICYVHYPAVTKTIPVRKIITKPTFIQQHPPNERYRTVKRQVIETPATIREIEIPAEYTTIQKRVLVKDATVDSVEIKPELREEVFLVRDRSADPSTEGYEWKKIECALLDFNILPIFYPVNSAALTAQSKSVIDEKLLKLMLKRPELRVEINSHTDSRASDAFNLDLSKRRAQAVVDYLVSRGVKRSRLEYNGYGETQLVNHCGNGVDCTEEQHAQNRRTEFRVLPR